MVQFSGSSIAGIVISVIILFVLIFNVIYIGGVQKFLNKADTTINLSKGAANFIYWTDIVLIILVALYLIYIIIVIFTTPNTRANLKERVFESQAGRGANLYNPRQG